MPGGVAGERPMKAAPYADLPLLFIQSVTRNNRENIRFSFEPLR